MYLFYQLNDKCRDKQAWSVLYLRKQSDKSRWSVLACSVAADCYDTLLYALLQKCSKQNCAAFNILLYKHCLISVNTTILNSKYYTPHNELVTNCILSTIIVNKHVMSCYTATVMPQHVSIMLPIKQYSYHQQFSFDGHVRQLEDVVVF